MDSKRMSRRHFLASCAGVATGLLVAACAPKIVKETVIKEVEKVVKETVVVEETVVIEKLIAPISKPAEKAELMFMSWGGGLAGGMDKVWHDECLPVFNEGHPNIHVDFTPAVAADKLIAAFVAGNAPDIVSGSSEHVPDYWGREQLLDFGPYAERDLAKEDLEDWYPEQYHSWETPEGWYALPMYCGTLVIFYNVDLWDELGLDRPPRYWKDAWDHDDFKEAMLSVVKKDASGETTRWGSAVRIVCCEERIQQHINAFGGHWADPEDNTRAAFGDPKSLEALWWIYDRIWEDDCFPQYAQVQKVRESPAVPTFTMGKTGMLEEGVWTLRSVNEQAKFKWNITPFPKGPERHVTLATSDAYAIWRGTKYPEAAWELLKFVTGEWFGKVLIRVFFILPARRSNLSFFTRTLRQSFPALEEVDLEVFGEGLIEGYGQTQEFLKKPGASMEIYDPALDAVFIENTKTPDYFKEIAEKVTEVNRA